LTIGLGAKVVHAAVAGPETTAVRFSVTDSTMAIGPDLLKRGARVVLGIVTEARPRLDRKSTAWAHHQENLATTT
jgi:hypothetical protein